MKPFHSDDCSHLFTRHSTEKCTLKHTLELFDDSISFKSSSVDFNNYAKNFGFFTWKLKRRILKVYVLLKMYDIVRQWRIFL